MPDSTRLVLEDSGLHYGPIHDDPDGMIAEIGISSPEDAGGTGLMFTNLSIAESKALRDFLSARIEAAEESA